MPAAQRPLHTFHVDIIYLLAEHGPLTDLQLERRFNVHATARTKPWPWQAPSGLRTRRSELVSWGMVQCISREGKSLTGRPARLWALAEPMPLVHTGTGCNGTAALRVGARLWKGLDEASGNLVIRVAMADVARIAGIVL